MLLYLVGCGCLLVQGEGKALFVEGDGAITCDDRGSLIVFEDGKASHWYVNTVFVC